MPHRLHIGIIGLGRRWRRYRPALAGLGDRLVVRAICDQRPARAERAARELGCAAAAGPTDLLDRDEVEAVLLLDAQWFGLWPLEQAARMGKPVFCAVPLTRDDAHADAVVRQVRAVGLPVMAALGPALSPAVARLRDLLAARLGTPRLVRCDWCGPGGAAAFPGGDVLPALMHVCAGLLCHGRLVRPCAEDVETRADKSSCAEQVESRADKPPVAQHPCAEDVETRADQPPVAHREDGEPVSVWTTASTAARFAGVLLEFGDGRAAHFNLWTATGVRPACRFQVVTDAGDATAELPHTLRWRDGEGRHTVQASCRPLPRLLLEQFLDALSAGAPPEPCLDDAYRALLWTRAARRSLAEGRRVELAPGGPEMKTV